MRADPGHYPAPILRLRRLGRRPKLRTPVGESCRSPSALRRTAIGEDQSREQYLYGRRAADCYPTWHTRTICATGSIAPNCVAIAARRARWSPELAGDDARKPRAGGVARWQCGLMMHAEQLNPAPCYRALQTRDARFDGRLFVGVISTGIYCRPTCPARTPKFENCR